MKQYEVTFIVDPVLSGDEIKATAQTYTDLFTKTSQLHFTGNHLITARFLIDGKFALKDYLITFFWFKF